jgi:nucleoside-diphosphate-sugar epimerase
VESFGTQTKHLGFQLAKTLAASDKIDSVTILQDSACNLEAEPFKSYASDIPDAEIIYAKLADESMDTAKMQELLGGSDAKFEYIYDNFAKGPEGSSKALCDIAKGWDCVKLYTYVSSAGMYQPDDSTTFPMDEATTPIKESAGQNQMDKYIAEDCGLPLVSFRPQYIYGENSNKHDYIDWFFDRLLSKDNVPLLIPSPGTQKVSLTNSEDVAALLTAPLGNEAAAVEQRYFNCGTDKIVTYDEVAYLCAEAAGIAKEDVAIEHYSGDDFGKAKFPFRLTDFYVAPDTAKEKLGYPGASKDLKDDIAWYYENYKSRDRSKVDFSKDQEILAALEVKA